MSNTDIHSKTILWRVVFVFEPVQPKKAMKQEEDACRRVQVTTAFWMTRLLSTLSVLDSIDWSRL